MGMTKREKQTLTLARCKIGVIGIFLGLSKIGIAVDLPVNGWQSRRRFVTVQSRKLVVGVESTLWQHNPARTRERCSRELNFLGLEKHAC